MLSINLNIGNIVLENSWDIDLVVQSVSVLLYRMCSCEIVCASAILAVLTRKRGGRVGASFDSTEIGWHLTSGKVPLEKTLCGYEQKSTVMSEGQDLHQEAGLPAAIVTPRLALNDLLM